MSRCHHLIRSFDLSSPLFFFTPFSSHLPSLLFHCANPLFSFAPMTLQHTTPQQTILDLEGSLTSLPSILYAHSVTGFGMFPAPSGPSRFQEAEAEVGLGIDSAAEKRRKVKSELFPHKDRVKKARLFGFNKIAVTLSSRCLQHCAMLCSSVLCYIFKSCHVCIS